jgi:hypothetical protein
MTDVSLDSLNNTTILQGYKGYVDRNQDAILLDLMARWQKYPQIRDDIESVMNKLSPGYSAVVKANGDFQVVKQGVVEGAKLSSVGVMFESMQGLEPGQVNIGQLYWLAAHVQAGRRILLEVEPEVLTAMVNLIRESPESPALSALQTELESSPGAEGLIRVVNRRFAEENDAVNKEGKVNVRDLLLAAAKQKGKLGNADFIRAATGEIALRVSAFNLENVSFEGLKDAMVERILLTISGIPLKILADQMKKDGDYEKLKKYVAQFA